MIMFECDLVGCVFECFSDEGLIVVLLLVECCVGLVFIVLFV